MIYRPEIRTDEVHYVKYPLLKKLRASHIIEVQFNSLPAKRMRHQGHALFAIKSYLAFLMV
jgi:hypothetical protein